MILESAVENTVSDGAANVRAPSVSVVIPCYNEELYIAKVLKNLSGQYPHDRFEIIVVDGKSTDKTRDVISAFAVHNPLVDLRLVENEARHIPSGLNLGIGCARGEIIVRMDAHSVPSENYVGHCVNLLMDSKNSVVGMPWRIRPGAASLTARAIARAVAHPFGIGDAKYRSPKFESPAVVDTVPFGAFRKSLWRDLGGFNEDLLTNEDYDFNYRVRQKGGRVLLDPAAHSTYFSRATFSALWTQYHRYGVWKARMLKLHPRSVKFRQLVAPLFVVALALSLAAGFWWTPALWAAGLLLASYGTLASFCAGRSAADEGDARLAPLIVAAFGVVHFSWGIGFLRGLVSAR